ncbi:MAG: alanine racemase [Mariprofundales bacterium]|nr:alanine racemase [Mariprofundales bacterium]
MSRSVIARLNSAALAHNYQLLQQLAGEASLMAVVKANAYGHGLEGAATRLWDAGCRQMAVTDAEEGVTLRELLRAHDPASEAECEIALLSGLFDDADAALICTHRLTPVIHDKEEVARLLRARFAGRLWVKMDTGMHRLGAEAARQLLDRCYRRRWPVIGLMSHLACADDAEHPLNAQQVERMRSFLNLLGPIKGSLLNSAGLITMPNCALDVVRPGIALYGAEPVADKPVGLQPVMQLEAKVMQVRKVAPGEGISYGAEFVADRPMRVAVVCAGYGDGVPRLLGARGGEVMIADERMPIVGRICMDYTMVDITGHTVRAGDTVQFWGADLLATEVATRCETISYELFTGVSERVKRHWE